jgi:hypothetical protein
MERNSDGLTQEQINTAYEVLEVVRENHHEEKRGSMARTINEAYYLVQLYEENNDFSEPSHSFDVGDYAIDGVEPTPSPEVNTVRVVELIDQRADEFVVEDTGKVVSEHQHNHHYPDDDLVVAAVYPNMGKTGEVWHFPESRLRRSASLPYV